MSRHHHAPRSSTRRDAHRKAIARSRAACHICGQPIDYDLPSTDPMSFVVDHVIPLAKGGSDDDHDNLKPAHHDVPCEVCGQRCNRSKGARLIAPIVKRSGALQRP